MSSGNSFSKGNRAFNRLTLLFIVCVLLTSLTACGSVFNTAQSGGQEQTKEASSTIVSDSSERQQISESPSVPMDTSISQDIETAESVFGEAVPVSGNTTESENMEKLRLEINGTEVVVIWEDNESAAALTELVSEAPITVQMSMYGGFEQVGSFGVTLPRNDTQTTTQAGDIVLYSGNQIVVFYGSNSWAYTRLGHVELSAAEMAELLGHGDVEISLSAE